jgi:hypothetical protein
MAPRLPGVFVVESPCALGDKKLRRIVFTPLDLKARMVLRFSLQKD